MCALMLGRAEKPTLRRDAFAARQVHAALGALDHVFAAGRGWFRLAAVNAAAIAFQEPVNKQQPENEENDFGQLRAPNLMKYSLRCHDFGEITGPQ